MSPFLIRRLPTLQSGSLVDSKSFPPNTVFLNPSAAGDFTYLRAIRYEKIDQMNYALIHDTKRNVTHTINSPMDMLKPTANMFKGIEDLRIVQFKDRLWFTATSTHASHAMNSEMVLGYFDKALTRVERMSTIDAGPLPVKNVCPFVYGDGSGADGSLRLIDTWRRVIYEVEEVFTEPTGTFERFALKKVANFTAASGIPDEGLRGSTSPIHLHGNTWGFVVHDMIVNDSSGPLVNRLSYFHHWVEMDMARNMITYFSSPFWIQHWGIEYVSGIKYLDREKGLVELYYGIQDQVPAKCITRLCNLRIGK